MSNHDIDKLIEKNKEILKSLSNNKSIDSEAFNSNVIALKQIIALHPELSKEVGVLIQKLLVTKKFYDLEFDLVQVPVLQGRISIDHRLKNKEIPMLKREGITQVLTLLSKKEGAEKIGETVRSFGITDDLKRRESEHKGEGKKFSKMEKVGPAVTRKSALKWERENIKKYKKNHGGTSPKYND